MREIKFRVWDKSRRAMGVLNEIKYAKNMYTQVKYTMVIKGKPVDEWSLLDENFYGTCALMQYTGLKDKNGKEIYEGDIVSFEDSDGGYEYQDIVINAGIVEYRELRFYFTNRVAVEMDDFYIKDGRCDEIEVIGNIYENPELLEEGKP